MRYLERIIEMRLIFDQELAKQLPKDLVSYRMIGYIGNNFAKNLKDRKSVMGYCFFINRAILS